VISAASGTSALVGAILAVAGRISPDRPLCFLPGYAFVAAPLAAELCGYTPYIVDVDEQTWAIDPEKLSEHRQIDKAGVVICVAPYGRRFSQSAWTRFVQKTGVPVIIDAAAGVETLVDDAQDLIGLAPIVLSFHATKAFGLGEGGAVICGDPAKARATRIALNFGFNGTRETVSAGLNGKMSEYHAAIGLAELDGWSEKRSRLLGAAGAYREMAKAAGVIIHTAPEISSVYSLFEAPCEADARVAQAGLAKAGIEERLWYGRGIHREAYFKNCARDPLPIVEALAPRLIGLPTALDLTMESVKRIVATLTGS